MCDTASRVCSAQRTAREILRPAKGKVCRTISEPKLQCHRQTRRPIGARDQSPRPTEDPHGGGFKLSDGGKGREGGRVGNSLASSRSRHAALNFSHLGGDAAREDWRACNLTDGRIRARSRRAHRLPDARGRLPHATARKPIHHRPTGLTRSVRKPPAANPPLVRLLATRPTSSPLDLGQPTLCATRVFPPDHKLSFPAYPISRKRWEAVKDAGKSSCHHSGKKQQCKHFGHVSDSRQHATIYRLDGTQVKVSNGIAHSAFEARLDPCSQPSGSSRQAGRESLASTQPRGRSQDDQQKLIYPPYYYYYYYRYYCTPGNNGPRLTPALFDQDLVSRPPPFLP